ncbi:hypothetical protein B566_EDAN011968 [Ephemera danica]|nr:hypothetical protein B566_EDAN011968 [Ephemera danica]
MRLLCCCVWCFFIFAMATNLVKWWKTRFLNGYKQFTVLMPADSCSESGRPSDTEELLSSVSAAHSSRPPHQRPPASPAPSCPATPAPREPCCCSSQAESAPRRELKFEEFECDVAVQGEEPQEEGAGRGTPGTDKCRQCGPSRQEFSFTLYDLDGHGKITKDDIAGLVTTIYETLGATIQVPHTGSKTIRVRLTVAPESRANASSNAPSPQKNCPSHKAPAEEASSPHLHNKCNKESLYHNLSPSKLANNAEQLYSQLNFSSTPTNKSKNEVYYTVQSPNNNTESVHYCSRRSPMLGHKVETVRVCNSESCSSPYKTTTNSRLMNNQEESSSSSRLLLLPCDNEATPQLSPKPSVRFCNNETAHNLSSVINNVDSPLTTKKLSNDMTRREKAHAKFCTNGSYSTPNSPLRLASSTKATLGVASPRSSAAQSQANPAEVLNSGAGRERAYSGTLQRQELLHIIQANMEKNLLALQHNSTTHHRKRGEEGQTSHSHHRHHSTASQKTNPAARRAGKTNSSRLQPRKTTRTTVDPTNNVISCSHYYLDLAGLEASSLCPHCDKGKKGHARSKSHDTTSHHLLRHKTRELDHARAMAQVVEWLQGAQLGASPPLGTPKEEEEEEEEDDEQEEGEGGATRTHRHIHEHVHHHYHHYTDSQLVV